MTTGTTTSSKRKTWVSVVIALAIIFVVSGIAVVASGVMFFYRHINSVEVAPTEAGSELQRTRARFLGQQPLLELTGGQVVRHPTPQTPRQPIAALHVLSYNSDDGELTSIDLPGWALRLVPSMSGVSFFEKFELTHGTGVQITLEDLERHGPGLIVDARRRDMQALVWTE